MLLLVVEPYIAFSVTFLVALFIAFIFEKVFLNKLQVIAAKTKWEGDDIILGVLKGKSFILISVCGLYLATLSLRFEANILNAIQNLVMALIILVFTWILARITAAFFYLYSSKNKSIVPSISILSNLSQLLVYVIGALIILQSLGLSITPILTALGVGGLAVALALQDTLSNLFSGIYLILSRKVKPGDYIKLDSGEEGYVMDITWRNTVIRALANNHIIVPNNKVATAIITNYHLPEKELSLVIDLGVSYSSDLDKVEKVTIETAKEIMKEIQGGVPSFEPFVRYNKFDDFSINFSVILRIREFVDQYLIKHEFIKRLHKRFRKYDIEIPFPVRTVYIKEDEKTDKKNSKAEIELPEH
ncbi:MAG: mechanosensitive ion channel family protein [Candidatus Margulisbacteria bacterium]|nr:mechanosensitive ion channel family protein [Candidatus Margulisiibacteriota bacterium]